MKILRMAPLISSLAGSLCVGQTASAVPVEITRASCSAPGGRATLTMKMNPFAAGQWIAVRDAPRSEPVLALGESVGTGDGSTKTFTFQTANYPIRRGSITLFAGGSPQGTDSPGALYAGVGQLEGPGIGVFSGVVTVSNGTAVTLTSAPPVFDPRWQAFIPTIAGFRSRYIVGGATDATHLTLMAPATDGAGQSFTLSSQVNYVTGVIEVTFASAPAAGASITINYTAEPSRWDGEHKVESATSTTVTFTERNCTAASANVTSGRIYAIPIIYVAPASHTNCAYDGDGGQPCRPGDMNPGATKALPKATLGGVLRQINRSILTIPYLIQLADANGSGLGGSTPDTDCYQPDEVTFSGVTMGGSPVDENEWLRVDEYPQSYWWVHGNSTPGRVFLNGSGTCTGRSIGAAEAIRFDHTAARLDGFTVQGYGNVVHRAMGPSAISFVNFATGYVEDLVCNGASDLNRSSVTLCIGAWDHSTLKTGGSHTVRNANWVMAVNESNLFTADPADGPQRNTTLDYSSGAGGFAISCSIMSNCQLDHITETYSGTGNYVAHAATEKSAFYFAERYVGSQCPNAACVATTINASNMTWESAQLGGKIDATCGNHQQGVCTVLSGPAVRAYAQEDSYIKEYSQSVIKGPDITAAGGCVAVWNDGWQTHPGWQPPTCASQVIKSESKVYSPLTLQNASDSNADLLDLKTGSGDLAAAFNSSGQLSRINNVAAMGNGVPAEVYSTTSAVVNAGIAPTTMFTPNADENFGARVYVAQVDAGVNCSTSAKVAVNLIYNDPDSGGPQPFTFVLPLNLSGSASPSTVLTLSTGAITVANVATGSIVFRAKGATPIQYSTTYTKGDCVRQPRYRITSILEWF